MCGKEFQQVKGEAGTLERQIQEGREVGVQGVFGEGRDQHGSSFLSIKPVMDSLVFLVSVEHIIPERYCEDEMR